ncbi:ABC transporter ATP-binding protein [Sabulicella glaciei]|uniref:ABC transporter ATP-binding protein n=1 Tax=Sabulicella glaciei TaxID=2984948 RepID=A0ABT3NVT4_9PROT|nr:ABC transporter ATP-binding protein [Roseococcus sp. MDT2-1-1]
MAVEALRLDGVTRRFGAVTALHGASLVVAPGEFVTLLGPSGCGKTTLLNLVAGFQTPDEGEIFLGGESVTRVPVWKRDIGMVFQSYALFPHMNVAENVAYGLRARGMPKVEAMGRVAEALRMVRLSGLEDRRPRQLSGGQQQRAALARALVIRPRILLLDEPFSALDRALRGGLQVEVREIQRAAGVATLFVTHDQHEALAMSDRIAVMSGGRIHQVGTPEEVYARPADRFVAGFVGDATVLRGRLRGLMGGTAGIEVGQAVLEADAAPLRGLSQGAPVDAFLRPETLSPGGPALLSGEVRSVVFQGGHVDVHLACAEAAGGRAVARLAPMLASGLAAGSVLELAGPSRCAAFPAEEPA